MCLCDNLITVMLSRALLQADFFKATVMYNLKQFPFDYTFENDVVNCMKFRLKYFGTIMFSASNFKCLKSVHFRYKCLS